MVAGWPRRWRRRHLELVKREDRPQRSVARRIPVISGTQFRWNRTRPPTRPAWAVVARSAVRSAPSGTTLTRPVCPQRTPTPAPPPPPAITATSPSRRPPIRQSAPPQPPRHPELPNINA
uniref:(northern house mosquito) hypothetical protein n=1 Tax=Culex pipiens TaxID=7175 RepID=A0A8D8HPX2_CULPI